MRRWKRVGRDVRNDSAVEDSLFNTVNRGVEGFSGAKPLLPNPDKTIQNLFDMSVIR
jgi:hypothetical protein